MLHEVENNLETELFLKQNGKKFSKDCITAMRLMFSGVKLNGDTCKELYSIHDRRLRDCFAARPDIVKKEWVYGADGKKKYVEYWIEKFQPPTKKEVVGEWTKKLKRENGSLKQLDLL